MSRRSLPTASRENKEPMWTVPTCDEAESRVFRSYSAERVTENVFWLRSLRVVVPGSAHLPLQGII